MKELNLYSQIEQDLGFGDEIAKLYDAYTLLINQIQPSSIIDIGCGQGDFLLKFQDSPINTFGIDLSSEQIKVCKKKKLNASCIDICKVKENFSCATAMFDVLNYINEEALNSFIKGTYDVLNEDGYFIFDINTLFGFEEVAVGSLNINKEDKFIGIDANFEEDKLITNIILFEKLKNNSYTKKEENITQYYHSKEFLEDLLKDIGFSIENIINFKLHDDENADKFIFICTK